MVAYVSLLQAVITVMIVLHNAAVWTRAPSQDGEREEEEEEEDGNKLFQVISQFIHMHKSVWFENSKQKGLNTHRKAGQNKSRRKAAF